MKVFDYAIFGGGASGLSLALAVLNSPLKDRSIVLIEKEAKDSNDRTWCYWTDQPSPYDPIRHAVWDEVRFVSEGIEKRIPLQAYRYQMLRGIDFYRYARSVLAGAPNVEIIQAEVGEVEEREEGVEFKLGEQQFRARWAFDSRFDPRQLPLDPSRQLMIQQHFEGWKVETEKPSFNPCRATLFDLRTSQQGGLTFFYILPFSERQALVEYTVFSCSLLEQEAYQAALQEYLDRSLGEVSYRVLDRESGVIPMTDYAFPRRLGKHRLAIGTRGGRVKPSSGYAFSRIQADSQAIVQSLLAQGNPFALPREQARRRFYDSLLLRILAYEPEKGKPIFEKMFTRNPIRRIFRFLDESSTLLEDILLIASLPPWPFLRALARYLREKLAGLASSNRRIRNKSLETKDSP